MYLEFDLAHDWYLDGISDLVDSIAHWSQNNNVRHQTKIVKHCLRVTFDEDKIYTWFMATWAGPENRPNFRLIHRRNF